MGEDPPVATARKIESALRAQTPSSLSAATGLSIEYIDTPKLSSSVTLPEWMTVPQMPPRAPSPAVPRAWLVMEPAVAGMTAVMLLLLPLTIFLGCYILCRNRTQRRMALASGGGKMAWSPDQASFAWLSDPASFAASPQPPLPRSPPGTRDLFQPPPFQLQSSQLPPPPSQLQPPPFQLQPPQLQPPPSQLQPSPSQLQLSPSGGLRPSRLRHHPSVQSPSSQSAASGEMITIHRWRNNGEEASPDDEERMYSDEAAAVARSPEIKLTDARERRPPLTHSPSRVHSRVHSREHGRVRDSPEGRRVPSRTRIHQPPLTADEASDGDEETLLHDIYADSQRHQHAASAVRLRRELSQWRADLQRREASLEHGLTLGRSPLRAGDDRYSQDLRSERMYGPQEHGTKSSPPTRMQRGRTPSTAQNIRQVV